MLSGSLGVGHLCFARSCPEWIPRQALGASSFGLLLAQFGNFTSVVTFFFCHLENLLYQPFVLLGGFGIRENPVQLRQIFIRVRRGNLYLEVALFPKLRLAGGGQQAGPRP